MTRHPHSGWLDKVVIHRMGLTITNQCSTNHYKDMKTMQIVKKYDGFDGGYSHSSPDHQKYHHSVEYV